MIRSSRPEVFCRKGVLRNFAKFTGKHLCQRLNFIKKETLAQVFSCELCKIFKNAFFTEQLRTTASIEIKVTSLLRPTVHLSKNGNLCKL